MASNTVNLTVHRNNQERRERKAMRQLFLADAKGLAANHEIAGYVIVSWDANLDAMSVWEAGDLPGSLVPAMAAETLRRALGIRDIEATVNPAKED